MIEEEGRRSGSLLKRGSSRRSEPVSESKASSKKSVKLNDHIEIFDVNTGKRCLTRNSNNNNNGASVGSKGSNTSDPKPEAAIPFQVAEDHDDSQSLKHEATEGAKRLSFAINSLVTLKEKEKGEQAKIEPSGHSLNAFARPNQIGLAQFRGAEHSSGQQQVHEPDEIREESPRLIRLDREGARQEPSVEQLKVDEGSESHKTYKQRKIKNAQGSFLSRSDKGLQNARMSIQQILSKKKRSESAVGSAWVYLGGDTIQSYRPEKDETLRVIVARTFMSRWTFFFRFFQVIYLLAVILALLVASVVLFWNKLYLDSNEVYKKYVKDEQNNKEKYGEGNPAPTLRELEWLSYLFRLVIILVTPMALLVYRSRLLQLEFFNNIKKHHGSRRGIAYSRTIEYFHYLFCCSRLYQLNYIDYIQFKHKNHYKYAVIGELSAIIIIILIIFFYVWNNDIVEFQLPWYYLMMICLLLFQKQVTFLIKMAVFPVCYGVHALIVSCCGYNAARCIPRDLSEMEETAKQKRDWRFDLEFDPLNSDWRMQLRSQAAVGRSSDELVTAQRFTHKKFFVNKYSCVCLYKTHMCLYPFLQWLSLMYFDRNKYLKYRACEYCGEQFSLFEMIFIPKHCERRKVAHRDLTGDPEAPESGQNALLGSQFPMSSLVQQTSLTSRHSNSPYMASRTSQRLASTTSASSLRVSDQQRPHFYHIICADLLIESRKENSKSSSLTKEELEACLTCVQEHAMQKELAKEQKMRKLELQQKLDRKSKKKSLQADWRCGATNYISWSMPSLKNESFDSSMESDDSSEYSAGQQPAPQNANIKVERDSDADRSRYSSHGGIMNEGPIQVNQINVTVGQRHSEIVPNEQRKPPSRLESKSSDFRQSDTTQPFNSKTNTVEDNRKQSNAKETIA